MNLSVILEQDQKTKGSRWKEKGGRQRYKHNSWTEGSNYPSVAWIHPVCPISATSPRATDSRGQPLAVLLQVQPLCLQDAQNYSRPRVGFERDCEHGVGFSPLLETRRSTNRTPPPGQGSASCSSGQSPRQAGAHPCPEYFHWEALPGPEEHRLEVTNPLLIPTHTSLHWER